MSAPSSHADVPLSRPEALLRLLWRSILPALLACILALAAALVAGWLAAKLWPFAFLPDGLVMAAAAIVACMSMLSWATLRMIRAAAPTYLDDGEGGKAWAVTVPGYMAAASWCVVACLWVWVILLCLACLWGLAWPAIWSARREVWAGPRWTLDAMIAMAWVPPRGFWTEVWASLAAPTGATLLAIVALSLPVLLVRRHLVAAAWRRRAWLLAKPATLTEPSPELRNGPGRRIVILCDGTSNAPAQMVNGRPAPTNIARMAAALGGNEVQSVWYDPGVATGTSRIARAVAWVGGLLPGSVGALAIRMWTLVESATGVGIGENITQGYAEVARRYRPGDQIYLLGFSRGAYTARCIAGMISRGGLLRPEHADRAADAFELYATRPEQDGNAAGAFAFHPAYCQSATEASGARRPPRVRFLGVFDTVASLGVPLWGWWFNHRGFWANKPISTAPADVVSVHHALSMDERRSQFLPTLFAESESEGSGTAEQVWFRGDHCDIGGGHAETGLSDITLGWMVRRASRAGLVFDRARLGALHPDPMAVPHDRIRDTPYWAAMGSWPRWCPADRAGAGGRSRGFGTLHASVRARAARMWQHNRGDLVHLDPGESLDIVVGSNRQWNRSGLVLEQGATYRVTWLGGEWRDAFCRPCAPAGDDSDGWLRLKLKFRRRMPDHPYMRLCGIVAHPRQWPLQEYGLRTLARFLLVRDPRELRRQVIPFGRGFQGQAPGAEIFLTSAAPDGGEPPACGLLHLFANDWWQTVDNNTGAITLRVTRVECAQAEAPIFRLRWPAGKPPVFPPEDYHWAPDGSLSP